MCLALARELTPGVSEMPLPVHRFGLEYREQSCRTRGAASSLPADHSATWIRARAGPCPSLESTEVSPLALGRLGSATSIWTAPFGPPHVQHYGQYHRWVVHS